MNELKIKINRLQDMITIITQLLMSGKTAEPIHMFPAFSQLFEAVLNEMIGIYQEKGLDHFTKEIEYWGEQVGRITDAIESEDYFRIIDVFYFETRENIEQFKKIL